MKKIAFIVFMSLILTTSVSHAYIVNLTTAGASDGPVNGAYFSQGVTGASGSGKIASFVRLITNNSVEEGYNTDGRPITPFPDVNTSPTFTHSIELGHIPYVYDASIKYYEFLLDINESNDTNLISLDEIKIYLLTSGSVTDPLSSLGTPLYDLDTGGDSYIKLNGHNSVDSGSGRADMVALIPAAAFDSAATATRKYVYLYSKFGQSGYGAYPNNGGFEEWGVEKEYYESRVPEPASIIMMIMGLFGFGFFRRRK